VSPTNINSSVITISSNSIVTVKSISHDSGCTLVVTIQGVTFTYDSTIDDFSNLIFTGPCTIQLQGNTYNPAFVTLDIEPPFRKGMNPLILTVQQDSTAARTQTQTLVVSPTNTNSPVITVSSNSYVNVESMTSADCTVAVNIQGFTFTFDPAENTFRNIIFSGPCTIQLQGNTYNPAFATIEVVPQIPKSKTKPVLGVKLD
jgi:hypothetical protein